MYGPLLTAVFTPSHKSLFSLFEPGTVYIIPSYQRPYSWQALGKSDRNSQVNQMWDDLWEFFEDEELEKKEYFLGSMVLIERERSQYEVIDGQQRLTTVTRRQPRVLHRPQSTSPDVVTQRLILREATLEHICPQSPVPGGNWLKDFTPEFRADFGRRLGNMTLLTSKMNSSAKNGDFVSEQKHYERTVLPMTRGLARIGTIDDAFVMARHKEIVRGIYHALALA